MLQYIPVYQQIIFYRKDSSASVYSLIYRGTQGLFPLRLSWRKYARNICVLFFVKILAFYFLGERGDNVALHGQHLRDCQILIQRGCSISHPQQQHLRISIFPHPCKNVFLNYTHPTMYKMVSYCTFEVCFPDGQCCWTSFHVLTSHLYIFFWRNVYSEPLYL